MGVHLANHARTEMNKLARSVYTTTQSVVIRIDCQYLILIDGTRSIWHLEEVIQFTGLQLLICEALQSASQSPRFYFL